MKTIGKTIQGMPIIDATEAIEVTITPNDVRLGKKKNAHGCAAARALCREHQADAAIVHFSRAYVRRGDTWFRYAVPDMLRSEVVAFDRGGNFEPGDYMLHAIQPTQRLSAGGGGDSRRRQANKRDGSKPQTGNRPKRPYHVVTGVRARMEFDS
jgi:hypothetical protein